MYYNSNKMLPNSKKTLTIDANQGKLNSNGARILNGIICI